MNKSDIEREVNRYLKTLNFCTQGYDFGFTHQFKFNKKNIKITMRDINDNIEVYKMCYDLLKNTLNDWSEDE